MDKRYILFQIGDTCVGFHVMLSDLIVIKFVKTLT